MKPKLARTWRGHGVKGGQGRIEGLTRTLRLLFAR